MEIRPATPQDAAAAIEYLRELQCEGLKTILRHSNLPSLEEERRFIEARNGERGLVLLALDGDRVVGVLTADRKPHPQMAHNCEIGIGVLAPHRNQGLGGRLMEGLFDWARNAGLRRAELSILENNPRGLRFYEGFGFRVEGMRRGAVKVEEEYLDLLEMAVDVTAVKEGHSRKR